MFGEEVLCFSEKKKKKKIIVFEFYMMSLGFQDVPLFGRVQVGGGVNEG